MISVCLKAELMGLLYDVELSKKTQKDSELILLMVERKIKTILEFGKKNYYNMKWN